MCPSERDPPWAALVVLLRVPGWRTLARLIAFDLVVTGAPGSSRATVILAKGTALAEGLAAFALLIGLPWVVATASTRSEAAQRLAQSTPALLVLGGQVLAEALRRERLTGEEVLAALRQQGLARLDQAAAVVRETDGSLTVLRDLPPRGAGTLGPVRGWDGDRGGRPGTAGARPGGPGPSCAGRRGVP